MEAVTNILDYGIPFLVLLSIVVFVHEFGHFIVARLNGVKVEVFSIGFGKTLWSRVDKKGTDWKICLIPMGGYVKMFGDEDAASARASDDSKGFSEEEKKVSFPHKNVWQRMSIVAAGPLANFLFAIFVYAVVFATYGATYNLPIIDMVNEDLAAFDAGLKVNDEVIEIDGENISSFEKIKEIVVISHGSEMNMKIKRNDQVLNIVVKPRIRKSKDIFGNEYEAAFLGIGSSGKYARSEKYFIHQALFEATKETWNISKATLKALGQVIVGIRSSDELGGPIRIAEVSGQAAKGGFLTFIIFVATLSINLGLINLFPIPLLDGGHLMFFAIEAVLGRPLREEIRDFGLKIGFAIVVSLMVMATWNDVARIFERVVS